MYCGTAAAGPPGAASAAAAHAAHAAAAPQLIGDCQGEAWDLIALPGGMPGAERLRDCAPLIAMVAAQRAAGLPYAAICATPAVALEHHGKRAAAALRRRVRRA
jgi:4-methyl-5(b-hydroxyethyl)-thiazole monophosphate biosynthesis